MSKELFYVDEAGKKQDRKIHGEILHNADVENSLAYKHIQEAIASGLDPRVAKQLYGTNHSSIFKAESRATEWWDSLTRNEQLVYLKAHPRSIYRNKVKSAEVEQPTYKNNISVYIPDEDMKYYNKILKNIHPEDVANSILPNSEVEVSSMEDGIYFSINNEHMNIERGFARDVDGNLEVEHHYFKIKDNQGIGQAKTILRNMLNFYKKIGVTKIKLDANIDIGGYAWARYGWVPTQRHWNTLRFANINLLDYIDLEDEERKYVIKALKDPNPTAIRRLSAMTKTVDSTRVIEALKQGSSYRSKQLAKQPTQLSLGKLFFIGTDWDGILDLNDKASMEYFDAYIGNKS